MSQDAQSTISGLQTKGLIAGVVGLVGVVAAYSTDTTQFYQSYLSSYLYWIAIALGCLGWTMIHHVTQGPWGVPVKRIWESGARTLPLFALLFVPIYLGRETLFSWVTPDPADALIAFKGPYLDEGWWVIRAVLYFVIWCGLAYVLTGMSYKQDEEDIQPLFTRMRVISGPGLLAMALTVTFMSVDWAMSVDPHWFSTIFGFLFAASDLLAAMAFTIIIVKSIEHVEPTKKLLNTQFWHDYGNWLMATTMLWAYLSFSQFLIIWSGNTQEEAPWYLYRMGDGWVIISLVLIVFHFAVPFTTLLTRRTKRAKNILWKIAAYMLVMRYIDLYWIIQPSFTHGHAPHLSSLWIDAAILLMIGGFFVAFFAMNLKAKRLAPVQDPRYKAALEGAGGHH